MHTRSRPKDAPDVYFLFPGQGSQHPNMAREIYETEPVFREAVDRCAELLRPHLDADLRTLLYPAENASDDAKRSVTETINAQPAIFTVEYSLAQLWLSWGIRPKAMAGHSIGEFVAACLAGVISLDDALAIVALRGKMMQKLPAGGMLSVRLPEAETGPASLESRPTLDLLRATSLKERAELHWRIALPVMAVALTLLAVPLSRLRPRQGRYSRVWVAVVIYFIYVSLASAAKVWIERGTLPEALGLWWVHAVVAALAAIVILWPGWIARLRHRDVGVGVAA